MDHFLSPTTPPPTTPLALRYGLLTGLVSVVFSLILFLTKLDQSGIRWAGLLISIGGIYLAHQEYKKLNGGFMEYGQGLSLGTMLSAVAALLSSAFTYVYVAFVDPSFIQRILDATRAGMEAKGNLNDDQIEQGMAMTAKFTTAPMMFVFGMIFGVFFGFVLSLIISAITKNSRPQFE